MREYRAVLLWCSIPILLYLLGLRHLWFDAPTQDDYDAILHSANAMRDAQSPAQWLHVLFAQHNEHRIGVVRFVSWAMAEAFGRVDFRVLMLVGNLALVGILALAWRQFRGDVAPPLFAAAAFVLLQWSYYQAALMAMTALSNIGVVCFAFACLHFALSEDRHAAPLAAAFGVLAAVTQANGLFALPIAAAGCAVTGRRGRAAMLAVVAALTWTLYFASYVSPAHHPSPLEVFTAPWGALHLFLIMLGGVFPGIWTSAAAGTLVLAALAWLTWRGAWRSHPAAGLWVAFMLVSCASAAAGRIGFGVMHASRYAIYSSCLLMVILLCVGAGYRVRGRGAVASAVAAAALLSFGLSWLAWPDAVRTSYNGRALAKAGNGYLAVDYPNKVGAIGILRTAEEHRIYFAPEVHTFQFQVPAAAATAARDAGHIDEVRVAGNSITVSGWTDVPARVPGRSIALSAVVPQSMSAAVVASPDVAAALSRKDLMYSRFRIEASYASEEEARRAAARLCVVVAAQGYPPAQACHVARPPR